MKKYILFFIFSFFIVALQAQSATTKKAKMSQEQILEIRKAQADKRMEVLTEKKQQSAAHKAQHVKEMEAKMAKLRAMTDEQRAEFRKQEAAQRKQAMQAKQVERETDKAKRQAKQQERSKVELKQKKS